jgi:hypothetical protein
MRSIISVIHTEYIITVMKSYNLYKAGEADVELNRSWQRVRIIHACNRQCKGIVTLNIMLNESLYQKVPIIADFLIHWWNLNTDSR